MTFPGGVHAFVAKVDGVNTVFALDINEPQDEITAIENVLLGNTPANLTFDGALTLDNLNVSGDSGIGTLVPGARLEVKADGANDALKISRTGPAVSGIFDLGSARLNLTTNNGLLIIADVKTDVTNKTLRLGLTHYTNAEEPVFTIFANNQLGANAISIGGGSGVGNAATTLRFFTAANTTTLSGTERLEIDSAGDFNIWDGGNFVLGVGAGTEWGTATGEKQAWWGATPVVQQVLAVGGGATVDNVISLLQTLGLCKQA